MVHIYSNQNPYQADFNQLPLHFSFMADPNQMITLINLASCRSFSQAKERQFFAFERSQPKERVRLTRGIN